ncbi:MAG: PilZ domain-containing protein [Thermoanaerobaculia bacterium]
MVRSDPSDQHFREHSRAPVRAAVRLQFDTQEPPQEGQTANLSTGGMFVQSKNPRPVGTLLRFELMLGDGEPIKGVGEIVWIRPRPQGPDAPSGMGVQFGHLEESNHARLRAAVLETLGVDGLSEPPPEPTPKRPSPPPRDSPSADLAAKSPGTPSPPRPRSRAKPRSAKPPRSQAPRSLAKDQQKAQPSPLVMSGRTKTLIVILGLLALLLLLVT